MSDEQFESQLKKVKFFEERYENERYQWGIYSFMFDGREEEIQVIVDYKEKKIHKNLNSITELLNQQENVISTITELKEDNQQLKVILKDAEEEIDRLKKTKRGFLESVVENDSDKECSDCGEFMTEYHELDCSGTWTAEDYCNAGHDLEDTNPNSCKDYWDKI